MFTRMSHKQRRNVILGCLCLLTLLLATCRSQAKAVRVEAEVFPEPVVGEIVTLHIEAISPKQGGDSVFTIYFNEEINFLEVAPEWQVPVEDRGTESLEWHGQVTAGEPSVHEFTFCVTKPGNWGIQIEAGVVGKGFGENRLHILSTAESAQVIPSSEYGGSWTPPPKRTPTAIPEPVTISPECAGDTP